MSLELWKTVFEIGGVVVLFLTFVFGAGALFTSNRINEQQAEKLRGFDKELTDAQTALATQQERAAIAESDLLKLRDNLEKERSKTLQLQRSVIQRIIPQLGEGDKRNWDSLKPFKGVQVQFLYSPQREPSLFAGGLGAFPVNAGWILLGINAAAKNEIPDGVTVVSYTGPEGKTDLSTPAAQAFAEFLRTNGIEGVKLLAAKEGELHPNTVVVRIGQIPDPSRHLE